jgi:hypothetical protein
MEFQQAMISVTAGEISDTYSMYIIGINIKYIFNIGIPEKQRIFTRNIYGFSTRRIN